MSIYAISFDIKYDTDKGYDERYSSLMAAIRKCPTVWSETTSFCIVETSETLDALESRLWLSKFDSSKDILLVLDVGYDDGTIRGATRDRAKLKRLMPYVKEK